MVAPGIRRHGAGYQVDVRECGLRSYAQFPLEHDGGRTTLAELQSWQRDERARLRVEARRGRVPTGTLPADVAKYCALESVKRLPTYDERCAHLQEWVAALGAIPRRSITPLAIEEQRDAWMLSRGRDAAGHALPGYSASSVNKRLRALSNVFTKLDGRRAPNPAREVAELEEPDPEARGLPYDVIEAILAEIPESWIGTTKSKTRTPGKGTPRPAQNKARLRVIAYTGLSHSQLKSLTRADVDLEAATVRLVARRKGRKIQRAQDRPLPELLPLIPPAVDAFREFDRLDCWGAFSNSSLWKLFQRAAARLGLEGLRPYDFRHSFLTVVYDQTRDLRVTGAFGGQRTPRTTARYTIAAVAPHVREAADKVHAKLTRELTRGASEHERNAPDSAGRLAARQGGVRGALEGETLQKHSEKVGGR